MKKISLKIALSFALLMFLPGLGLSHESAVTISGPYDGQVFVTDSLPLSITVEGTISHSAPPNGANVADSRACVSLDGGVPTCQPAPVFGGNTPSLYKYFVRVSISPPGVPTVQAFTSKADRGDGGKVGWISDSGLFTSA